MPDFKPYPCLFPTRILQQHAIFSSPEHIRHTTTSICSSPLTIV